MCILEYRNDYIVSIYYVDTKMRVIKQVVSNEITVKNIKGFFEKTITKFGNGAKIDAPKEHIGKKVYVVIIEDGTQKRS